MAMENCRSANIAIRYLTARRDCTTCAPMLKHRDALTILLCCFAANQRLANAPSLRAAHRTAALADQRRQLRNSAIFPRTVAIRFIQCGQFHGGSHASHGIANPLDAAA